MSASAKKKLRKEEQAAQLTEKQLQEQKEAKKLKAYTTIFVVAIALVLVVAVVFAGINFYKNSGIKEKNTIAAEVAGHQINAVEMSYYYTDTIDNNYNSWYQSYGENLSMYMQLYGLDLSQPLSAQFYTEDTTWADYFVDMALSTAHRDYLLADKAAAEGFTLTEDSQSMLEQSFDNMPAIATLYGYSNADNYLRAMYGPGASVESYRAYAERSALASDYYNAYAENLVIDDAAIRAYEADKYDDYSSFSYATYTLSSNYFLTGGTEAEDGTISYSDEELNAARAAAKAAAESLPECATAEELNAAIAKLDMDESAPAEATVRNNILLSNSSSNIRQWLSDSNRKAGDFTVVANESTTTGEDGVQTTVVSSYTAYVFIGSNDNTDPMVNVRHILAAFEGGTTDDSGVTTYSDAEKAAALEKAESVLDAYKNGELTEDAFAELAKTESADTGSAANGGLIEDIAAAQGLYVQPFTDWSVDPARQPGDTGIIETTYGYHVMYFVGQDDMTYRDSMIREDILNNSVTTWYNDILATAEIVEKDTSRLNRDVILSR